MPYTRPDELRTWMLKDIEAQSPGLTVAEAIEMLNTDLPNVCPHCTGPGRYAEQIEGIDTLVVCETCQGMGATQLPVEVIEQPDIYNPQAGEPETPPVGPYDPPVEAPGGGG